MRPSKKLQGSQSVPGYLGTASPGLSPLVCSIAMVAIRCSRVLYFSPTPTITAANVTNKTIAGR
jgi:hypothetical protein